MYNNIFSLFSNGNDPKLAKELLENPEAMRDQASRKANDINFKVRYSKLVETALKTIKQKMRRDKKLSSGATMFCWLVLVLVTGAKRLSKPPAMGYLIPSTMIQDVCKAKSRDKRNRPGKILCCL
jgi:hypothetical protein